MKNQSSYKSLVLILIISNVITLAIIIYLLMHLSDKKDQIVELNTMIEEKGDDVESKTAELEELQLEYLKLRRDRSELGLANDSLDRQIQQLDEAIAQLKRVKELDEAKKRELNQLIASLKADLVEKDKEIIALRNERDSLASNVVRLEGEKGAYGDSLNAARQVLEYAAILKAQNISITGLKENGKELRDDEEFKQRRLDRVKVTFDLADNKAAKIENKTFYMAIKGPSGKVISNPAQGKGTFKTAKGEKKPYTLSKTEFFDNSGQTINLTMPRGFNYAPGTYFIDIYCEGYNIGGARFIVT